MGEYAFYSASVVRLTDLLIPRETQPGHLAELGKVRPHLLLVEALGDATEVDSAGLGLRA